MQCDRGAIIWLFLNQKGEFNKTMDEKLMRDYKIMYIMSAFHATLHLIIGIIWEKVHLPQGTSALLSLPYFGGQVALVAVAFLLVIMYLALSLRRQPNIPVHIRKFCLTLSIVIAVGSLILMVVMCIRTNDYRKEQDQLAREAYYGVVVMTVIGILATIFLLPCYIYLVASNYRLVKEEEKREKEKQAKNRVQGQEVRQNGMTPEDDPPLQMQLASTDRQMQLNRQQSEILQNIAPEESVKQQHSIRLQAAQEQDKKSSKRAISLTDDGPLSRLHNPTEECLNFREAQSGSQ